MNVKSVDSRSFESRGDRSIAAYNPRRNPRHYIDTIIALDDNSIRRIAYAKTLNTVDDDKHYKITKGLILAIPFVAGLASALLQPAKSSLLTKDISGAAGRLLNGAKTGALWGVLIGTGGAIIALRDKLEQKLPSFGNFTAQNQFLTFAGSAAAFAGALALGGKYIPKLAEKVLNHVRPESILKAENNLVKGADRFNRNSVIKSITKFAGDLKQQKCLEPLKGVVKTALDWAPSVLLCGSVLHSFNHTQVKNREFMKNYSEIKEYQNHLAKARIRELSIQNESLNKDNQYSKDLSNLKDTVSDIKEVAQIISLPSPDAVYRV